MAGDNLPPDVTPGMVDDAMAPPEQDQVMGVVKVLVDEEVPEFYDDYEARRALMDKLGKVLSDADESFDVVDAKVEERWRID